MDVPAVTIAEAPSQHLLLDRREIVPLASGECCDVELHGRLWQ